MITLIFSLLGWGVIPLGPGLALSDFSLGILYSLALSSIGVYGILFAGWSANSKYAFLGSLRSTAQMISYELIYSAAVLTVILLCGTFNITEIIEAQQSVWYIVPLLPIFILFFISALAETNRTPFDLSESESELVAGFMTEHSGMIFVFFFLAEYGSIVLMSTFSAILFLGGYNAPELFENPTFINLQSLVLGVKAVLFMFLFVWVRATLPRVRYDQLIVFCWTGMLPLAIALLILVPSILTAFDITTVTPFYKEYNISRILFVISTFINLKYLISYKGTFVNVVCILVYIVLLYLKANFLIRKYIYQKIAVAKRKVILPLVSDSVASPYLYFNIEEKEELDEKFAEDMDKIKKEIEKSNKHFSDNAKAKLVIERLVMDYVKSGKPVTADFINSVALTPVSLPSITEEDLAELLRATPIDIYYKNRKKYNKYRW